MMYEYDFAPAYRELRRLLDEYKAYTPGVEGYITIGDAELNVTVGIVRNGEAKDLFVGKMLPGSRMKLERARLGNKDILEKRVQLEFHIKLTKKFKPARLNSD